MYTCMPDPPALSAEQIAQLLEENRQLRQERDAFKEQHQPVMDELKELKRLIFGSKKERFIAIPDATQLTLGLDQDPALPVVPLRQTVEYERIVKQVTKKANRQLFPAHLPRVEVIIEPTEDVSGMRKVGEEITEELDRSGGPLKAGVPVCQTLYPSPLRECGRDVPHCSTAGQGD